MSKKNILLFVLLILISVPAIFSLFHPGFFQSDDGEWMIIRFSAFHQALRDGQFPVRFLGRLNFGYGYTVANFLYPGFMYLAEPIKLLGFGFVNTIKIVLGLSIISSGFFAYLWLSKIFNRKSAFIGALFYLYTPYHLFDLYKRGSVGEVLALAVLPFVLWQIERCSLFWTSLGLGFLILSHNTLAFLFIPLIIIYSLIRSAKKYFNTLYILFGLGLSSFFWIPAVFELPFTEFSKTIVSDFSNYFAPIELIGLSSIFVLSISSFFLFEIFNVNPPKKTEPLKNILVLMVIVSFLSIFFSSKPSLFLWNYIPSSFIQFPFRLLSYLPVALGFLAAFIIFNLKKKTVLFIALFLLFLSFSVYPYLKPSEFFDKGDLFYATNEATTNVQNEYMPRWVKTKPIEHFSDKVMANQKIENIVYKSNKISFSSSSEIDQNVKVNTIYYPGWNALIDGKESKIQFENDGLINLSIPKGKHSVSLIFSETPLRLFADLISLISLVFLILISFKKKALQNIL